MIARIDCLVGARPNFVKMAAIYRALLANPFFAPRLIHSGQHYSPEMSDVFFEQLDIPRPDVNLEIGSGTQTEQTAECMRRLEPVFAQDRPRLLVVVGDVNSTLAGSLAATKAGISVAHVEAGLRSFDRSMAEEINRMVTDVISDYLFASEPSGVKNLLAEGVPQERIFLVGNVMIDTLLRFRQKAEDTQAVAKLGLTPRNYVLVTLHRPSNVDDSGMLAALMHMLEEIDRRMPVVFPVHPRTRARMEAAGLRASNVRLVPPQSYLEFICLLGHARLVLTDSGGIQEETTILGVPCLTLRENTERPVTIQQGTNRLAGSDPEKVLLMALESLEHAAKEPTVPDMWDGRAAVRVADHLARLLSR